MAIVNSDIGDKLFEIKGTKDFSNTGNQQLPITIIMVDGNKNYYNLEELDNIIRAMVEFRVTYDECRNITKEVKEEDILGEGEEYGIEGEFPREFIDEAHQALIQADNRYREEQEAYEAERIARELEDERQQYI